MAQPGRSFSKPLGDQPGPEGHRAGYQVLFTTAAHLIATLTKAHAEGRLDEKLKASRRRGCS